MRRTVLVTGGAGYVGAHVCKALASASYEPVTLDTLERGSRDRVRWGPLEVGDAGQPGLVGQVALRYKCIAAIHVAAYAFVGESEQHPGRYYRNNLVAALEACDSALLSGVRALVLTSTCSVYGDPGPEPVIETAPLAPISPYGRAKAIAELEVGKAARRAGAGLVNLRLFNAVGGSADLDIGESDYQQYGRLVPDALKAALGGGSISLNGKDHPTPDGTPVRDYVHVEDLANAHVKAMERALDGAYLTCNVATGSPRSVQEVLDIVRMTTGRALEVTWGQKRPGDPAFIVGDPTLAAKALDWHPRWSLEDAVLHAWRWRQRVAPKGH